MSPAIFWTLAFLAVLCMGLGIQQGIRLFRWAREIIREADRLEHPGEH
jgi:hypothetical protein